MEIKDKKKNYKIIIILVILLCVPIIVIIGLKIWINTTIMSVFDDLILAQYYKAKPNYFSNHYEENYNIISVLNEKEDANEIVPEDSWFDIYTSDTLNSHFIFKNFYLVYIDEEKKQPLFLVKNIDNLQCNTKYIVKYETSTKITKNTYAVMVDGYCEYDNWENKNMCTELSCYEASTIEYKGKYYCDEHYNQVTFVKCSITGCLQRSEKEYADPFSKTYQSHVYCIEHYNSIKNKMDDLYPCVLSGYKCDETGEKYIVDYLRFHSIRDGVVEGTLGSELYYCKKHFEKELSNYNQYNRCYKSGCENKPTYFLLIENEVLTINGSSLNALRKTVSEDDAIIIDDTMKKLDEICSNTYVSCDDHYNKVTSIYTESSVLNILNIREYRKSHSSIDTLFEEKCSVSDCDTRAIHSIKGIFNSIEYYCDKHYYEYNELLDFFEGESNDLGISDKVDFEKFR